MSSRRFPVVNASLRNRRSVTRGFSSVEASSAQPHAVEAVTSGLLPHAHAVEADTSGWFPQPQESSLGWAGWQSQVLVATVEIAVSIGAGSSVVLHPQAANAGAARPSSKVNGRFSILSSDCTSW